MRKLADKHRLFVRDAADELEELKRAVSSASLQVTLEESRKEYNC